VIVYGNGSGDQLERLALLCRRNGWEFKALAGNIGRPRHNHLVKNVLDAYKDAGTVRGAARLLSMPPGTVHGILKREGIPINSKK
jgi:hypothetical protein